MIYPYFTPGEAEQYSFFRIPKSLIHGEQFKHISLDAKLLYGILLDRVDLSIKNGWVDEKNHVYIIFTIEQIMEEMNCSNKKAISMLNDLEKKVGLIEKKRQGLGKPNLIYVKNFFVTCPRSEHRNAENNADFCAESADFPEVNNGNSQKCKNYTSADVENTSLGVKKLHSINTNHNKTDNNNTQSILSDPICRIDQMRLEYRAYTNYFRDALRIDSLIHEKPEAKAKLEEIFDLLVDTCTSTKETVRIDRQEKTLEAVKSQLMKLTPDHIRYVIDQMSNYDAAEIRNPRQFLLTSLYNSTLSMHHYYQGQFNHDRSINFQEVNWNDS